MGAQLRQPEILFARFPKRRKSSYDEIIRLMGSDGHAALPLDGNCTKDELADLVESAGDGDEIDSILKDMKKRASELKAAWLQRPLYIVAVRYSRSDARNRDGIPLEGIRSLTIARACVVKRQILVSSGLEEVHELRLWDARTYTHKRHPHTIASLKNRIGFLASDDNYHHAITLSHSTPLADYVALVHGASRTDGGYPLRWNGPGTTSPNASTMSGFAQIEYLPMYSEDQERTSLRSNGQARVSFHRDYERIVSSRAFRRLVDKAQVFGAERGDHYRTRMTHTQLVAQIARSIARSLSLNEMLTEAIAMAHDIGHTPFGHQGERTLDAILRGEYPSPLWEGQGTPTAIYGGFKHNFQSVRMLSSFEESHFTFCGINPTWQLLEGALWHTGVYAGGALRCDYLLRNPLYQRASDHYIDRVFHTGIYSSVRDHSITLEGQAVALADEIAQRSHDIDDALSSGIITESSLMSSLERGNNRKFVKKLDRLENLYAVAAYDGYTTANKESVVRYRIVSAIVSELIFQAVKGSKKALDKFGSTPQERIFERRLITYTKKGVRLDRQLTHIVNDRLLSSSEIAKFDSTGERVVSGLFEALWENPRLLPATTLRRLAVNEARMGIEEVVDLSASGMEASRAEVAAIKAASINDLPALGCQPNGRDEEFALKRWLLARTIVDSIAGMTDTYAKARYRELCG